MAKPVKRERTVAESVGMEVAFRAAGTVVVNIHDWQAAVDRIQELEARLKALEWTPITESNLPTVGEDEVGRKRLAVPVGTWIVCDASDTPFLQPATARRYRLLGWTHRRPINAPVAAQAHGEEPKP